jgi:hypothetical protein
MNKILLRKYAPSQKTPNGNIRRVRSTSFGTPLRLRAVINNPHTRVFNTRCNSANSIV